MSYVVQNPQKSYLPFNSRSLIKHIYLSHL